MVLRVLFECKTGVSHDYGLMYPNPGPSFGQAKTPSAERRR